MTFLKILSFVSVLANMLFILVIGLLGGALGKEKEENARLWKIVGGNKS